MDLEFLEPRLLMSVSVNAEGWTVVDPAADTKIIYVSSSSGSDSNSGLSEGQAVATLNKAVSLITNGGADWILLKRGDTFNGGGGINKSGRSADEPIYVSTYGSSDQRPLIHGVINYNGSNIITDGIHLQGEGKKISTSSGIETTWNVGRSNLVFENMVIDDFKTGMTFRLDENVTVRRCIVTDSTGAGIFMENYNGMTLIENVFDNNGYDSDKDGLTDRGHNIYESRGGTDFTAIGNIFSNGGDHGVKLRAETQNVTLTGNLFYGNQNDFRVSLDTDDYGLGWYNSNIELSDNVFINTGRSTQQTGIWIDNSVDVLVQNNLIVNSYGMAYSAAIRFENRGTGEVELTNVNILDNVIANFTGEGIRFSASFHGLNVMGNTIQIIETGGHQTEIYKFWPDSDFSFANNTYFSEYPDAKWFEVNDTGMTFDQWVAISGETGAVAQEANFYDDSRTVDSYNASIGGAASGDAFIAGARAQSKSNWNEIYTAESVNEYLYEGFSTGGEPAEDTLAPTASLTAADVDTAGATTYTFTVEYWDNNAIDVSDIDGSDIQVTGPNGYSQAATLVGVDNSSDGRPRTATYRVNAAGGSWDNGDNGTYTVSMKANQVTDTSENAVAAGSLGTFVVDIANPNAAAVSLSIGDANASEAGPDQASFVITKLSGNEDLTVNYTVSGTASNGDDFELLSGTVTILANDTQAAVVVVPVDDALVEGSESVTITLQASANYEITGNASATVDISDNDADVNDQVTLISEGAVWNYLDNGSNQGTAWRGAGFDDSSWSSGAGRFGYGNGGETTVIDYGGDTSNKYITTYFRRSFNVDDASAVSDMVLRLMRDDGAVVYINGQEVYRTNLPTGSIDWQTTALSSVDGSEETAFLSDVILTGDNLVDGENVIAVEIHQNRGTSSDLSFDLELLATVDGGAGEQDTTNPTASLSVDDIAAAGGSSHDFVVTFSDNDKVDISDLDSNDVIVRMPGGSTLTATFVEVDIATDGSLRSATYRVNAPGGSWDAADNGQYTVEMQANQVSDVSGNAVAAGVLGTFNVGIADVGAPVAISTSADIMQSGGTQYVFTVLYSGDTAIDAQTFGDNDIVVTGPNGYSQSASVAFVENSSDPTSRTVIYQVNAPAGSWDMDDNGTYSISMQANSVLDVQGHAVAAGVLATFEVSISDSTAPQVELVQVMDDSEVNHVLMVTFTDDFGIDLESLDDNDIVVTGSNGFNQKATLIDGTIEVANNGKTVSAKYRINAPDGHWDMEDNGTYLVILVANEISDTSGNFADSKLLGQFVVNESDSTAPMAQFVPTVGEDDDGNPILSVIYSDNVQMDVSSINNYDLWVTGPNGFNRTAELIGVTNVDGEQSVIASYRLTNPYGMWEEADNGQYFVAITADQVKDTSGNYVAGGNIGTFLVNIESQEQRIDDNLDTDFEGHVTVDNTDIKQVTWTDADGTTATLSLNEGSAYVEFGGENLDWIDSNNGKTILGDNVTITNITLSDTTEKTTLTIKGKGGDGFVDVTNISVGASIRQISATIVDLLGTLDVAGSLANASLHDLNGAQVLIGESDNPREALSFTANSVIDSSLNSQMDVKSITVTQWVDVDGLVDSISADSLGKLTVKGDNRNEIAGDFEANIALSGNEQLKAVLGGVKIAGSIADSNWAVIGSTGSISVGAVSGWDLDVVGDVKDIKVSDGDFADSDVDATSLNKLSVKGDLVDVDLNLDQAIDPKVNALGNVKVNGQVVGGAWDIAGHVGSVNAEGFAGDWAAVIDGEVKSIKSAGDFEGDVSALLIGSLSVNGNLVNADLNLSQIAADRTFGLKSLKVKGDVIGGQWNIAGHVGSVSANSTDADWQATIDGDVKSVKLSDSMAGALEANSIRSLNVKGDMVGVDLTLNQGIDAKIKALNGAKINGQITGGQWDIAGSIGSVKADSVASGWSLVAADEVKSISSKGDFAGDIAANSIGKMSVKGNMTDSSVTLSGTVDPENARFKALGKMDVKGWMTDSEVDSAGHIGSVAVGGMSGSSVKAGVDDLAGDLVDELSDFDVLASIGSFTTKGIRGEDLAFVDSNVAAANIGKISLKGVATTNGDESFGVTADEIKGYSRKTDNGTIKFRGLTDPDIAEDDDDYILRVV